jgi:hypothetical protein
VRAGVEAVGVAVGQPRRQVRGSAGTAAAVKRGRAPSTRRRRARAGAPRSIGEKSLMGIPWRYALACIDDLGLILRAEVIWSKPNGLPESVTDRVRRSHEQWFHFTLEPRYFSAVDEIREAHAVGGSSGHRWPGQGASAGRGQTSRTTPTARATRGSTTRAQPARQAPRLRLDRPHRTPPRPRPPRHRPLRRLPHRVAAADHPGLVTGRGVRRMRGRAAAGGATASHQAGTPVARRQGRDRSDGP